MCSYGSSISCQEVYSCLTCSFLSTYVDRIEGKEHFAKKNNGHTYHTRGRKKEGIHTM